MLVRNYGFYFIFCATISVGVSILSGSVTQLRVATSYCTFTVVSTVIARLVRVKVQIKCSGLHLRSSEAHASSHDIGKGLCHSVVDVTGKYSFTSTCGRREGLEFGVFVVAKVLRHDVVKGG